jgi:hypothetical protein
LLKIPCILNVHGGTIVDIVANFYLESLELQKFVDGDVGAERELAANLWLDDLNRYWNPGYRRAIRTNRAYLLKDGLTFESSVFPPQVFGEVELVGHVPHIKLIELANRLIVALPVFDGVVIGPRQLIEPELVDYELDLTDTTCVLPLDERLKRPVYAPVESLEAIMLAA